MKLSKADRYTTQSSPARNVGTVYQNTSGKPLFVSLLYLKAGGNPYVECDASNPPTTVIVESIAAVVMNASFIVLPGYYYRINADSLNRYTQWN